MPKREVNETSKKNLKPLNERTPEEKKAIQSAGGKASAKKRRENKKITELMKELFHDEAPNGKTYGESLILATLVKGIKTGDVRVLECFRDSLGEKPTNNVEVELEPETFNFFFDKKKDK